MSLIFHYFCHIMQAQGLQGISGAIYLQSGKLDM